MQLEFDNLSTLVPDEYAQHWQVTIEFLEIITKFWPSLLEEKGLMDAAQRRNFIMQAQLSHWRREAPDFPIIAAAQLSPNTLTAVLVMSSKRSTTNTIPTPIAMVASGNPTACKITIMATKLAEGMPATPIDVSKAIMTTVDCVTQSISIPKS